MEQETNSQRSAETKKPDIVDLQVVAANLLKSARTASSGRAGRTLLPGAGAPLQQTLLALLSGHSLSEHETPKAATLQVLSGAIRLTGGEEPLELRSGELAQIPPVRHAVDALEDAVVLITITP